MSNDVKIILSLVDKATAGLKDFREGSKKSFEAIGKFAAGAAAGIVAFKEIMEFGQEGANLLRLEQSGDNLAASFGGNMDDIVKSISIASNRTVAESDILLSANRAMMLGLGADAEELGQLMEVAAFRGRSLGLDTTQAFNDIVTGIGRASPLILDNLGIVIDSSAEYKKYAESIGISAKELTKAQQTQVIMNAVLKDGQEQIARAGGIADDTADKFGRMGAAIKDSGENIKKFFAPALGDAADAIFVLLKGGDLIEEALEEQAERLFDTTQSYEDFAEGILLAAKAAGKLRGGAVIQLMGDITGGKDAIELAEGLGVSLEVISLGAEKAVERFGGMTRAMFEAMKAGVALERSDQLLINSRRELNEVIVESLGPSQELLASFKEMSSETIFNAAASVLNAEASETLASAMGLVDTNTADAINRINELNVSFAKTGDVDAYIDGMVDIADATTEAKRVSDLLVSSLDELTLRQILMKFQSELSAEGFVDMSRELGLMNDATFFGIQLFDDMIESLDGTADAEKRVVDEAVQLALFMEQIKNIGPINIDILAQIQIDDSQLRALKGIELGFTSRITTEPIPSKGTPFIPPTAQQSLTRKGIGFARGGFTGSGPSSGIAGVVHNNEFVVPEGGALVSKGGGGGTINIQNMVFPNVTNGEEAFQEMKRVASQHGVQFEDIP